MLDSRRRTRSAVSAAAPPRIVRPRDTSAERRPGLPCAAHGRGGLAVELRRVAEQTRAREIHHRRVLVEIILHGRPGQQHAHRRVHQQSASSVCDPSRAFRSLCASSHTSSSGAAAAASGANLEASRTTSRESATGRTRSYSPGARRVRPAIVRRHRPLGAPALPRAPPANRTPPSHLFVSAPHDPSQRRGAHEQRAPRRRDHPARALAKHRPHQREDWRDLPRPMSSARRHRRAREERGFFVASPRGPRGEGREVRATSSARPRAGGAGASSRGKGRRRPPRRGGRRGGERLRLRGGAQDESPGRVRVVQRPARFESKAGEDGRRRGWRSRADRERGRGLGARRRTPTARDRRGVAMTHLVMIFFFAAAGGEGFGVSSGVAGTASPAPGEPPKAWAPSRPGWSSPQRGIATNPQTRDLPRGRGVQSSSRAPDSRTPRRVHLRAAARGVRGAVRHSRHSLDDRAAALRRFHHHAFSSRRSAIRPSFVVRIKLSQCEPCV